MESLELKIFREVAYTKSISKAAENLGYVQSNVTAHIKKLEDELNVSLLIRHSKGVTLTTEGEKLLYYAEQIISLMDMAKNSFNNSINELRIGSTQTITGYLLPQCLIEYQNKFPDISISVKTLNQIEMDEYLSKGMLDCIFSNSFHIFANAKEILRVKEKLTLVAPPFYTSIDSILNLPLVVNQINSCPYRITLLNWMSTHNPKMSKVIEFDTVEAIINAVSLGAGISLLPHNTLLNEQNINKFYLKELQTTSIKMWISQKSSLSKFIDLISLVKKVSATQFRF